MPVKCEKGPYTSSEGPDQPAHLSDEIKPRGYKTFFMLSSAEHEIYPNK